MILVESLQQLETHIDQADASQDNFYNNFYLYEDDIIRLISQRRLFCATIEKCLYLYSDEGAYYQMYFFTDIQKPIRVCDSEKQLLCEVLLRNEDDDECRRIYILMQEFRVKKTSRMYTFPLQGKDEFSSGLTDGQKNALRSLGLETDYYADIFRYSYIALIDSGSVVYEECSPDQLEVEYAVSADVSFTAKSAGLNSGNLSSVLFGDDEYSLNERGLNIVVFSKKLGWVIDSINFDTFAGADGLRGDSL